MPKVNDRAAAYGKASREYHMAQAKVQELKEQLSTAEEVLRKSELERNRTQRELLEEARHY